MAIGNYGIIRGADVNVDDISMYYNYTPNRETENNEFFQLNPADVLSNCLLPETEEINGYTEKLIEGMYSLKLPTSIFNRLGIYTIYIKPKTIGLKITDCGVLSAFPNVKGIVVNSLDLTENLRANNALQGFRIEYVNTDGTKLRNVVRYVVTSNKVVPVTENVGNTSQKSTRYRFDDNGNLIFLQLTPSSSSSIKANAFPFIGVPNQTILLSNTYFSPMVIEVNMVKNTIDTVANVLVGEQIRDVRNGIITLFDDNREITNQYNAFIIKDDVNDVPLYEVKEKRTNIDLTQNFDNVLSGIGE